MAALAQFKGNLARARDLLSLYSALSSQTVGALDLSDLLRAHIVLSVSALDHYVHELVREGMIEVLLGTRAATASYRVFPLTVHDTTAASNGGTAWFEAAIRRQHGWRSFQQPDKIAETIRLISDKKLWVEVGTYLVEPPEHIKSQLATIIDRRNKIAHEADLDPSFPGTRWPITKADAQAASDYIDKVVSAIDAVVV